MNNIAQSQHGLGILFQGRSSEKEKHINNKLLPVIMEVLKSLILVCHVSEGNLYGPFFPPFLLLFHLVHSTKKKDIEAYFLGNVSLSLSSLFLHELVPYRHRQYITPLNQMEEQQFFLMIPIWTVGICVRWKHHKQCDSTEPQQISIKPGDHLPFILHLLSMPSALPWMIPTLEEVRRNFLPQTLMDSYVAELIGNKHRS